MRGLRRQLQKGFTLVEVAILISILGIFSLVVMPDIVTSLQTLYLNNAAHKIAADIRFMREVALSRHDTYGIDFNTGANSYSLFRWDAGSSAKVAMTDPHTGGSMVVDLDTHPEFSGVTITSASEVRVNAFGTPMDSSLNALTGPVTITLTCGSLTQSIRVTHQTAFVELL